MMQVTSSNPQEQPFIPSPGGARKIDRRAGHCYDLPMRSLVAVTLLVFSTSCGGSQSGGKGAVAGDTFSEQGLAVSRPGDWTFIQPDTSVSPDTLVILQGPIGKAELAPVVEVARRPLSAAERRRPPSHILTAMVLEIVQTFDSYQDVTSPVDLKLGGHDAARIDLKFSESLPEGGSVNRSARFYGAVVGDALWLIRCLGPEDASAAPAFDNIVASVRFQ